jgi:N,N-dimethylformamidase
MTIEHVFGYADRLHVCKGDQINFHISSKGDRRYRASLVRLVNGCVDSELNRYREVDLSSVFSGEYPGREKKIYRGSYAALPGGASFAEIGDRTVLLCVYPTLLRGRALQTIVSVVSDSDKKLAVYAAGRNLIVSFLDQGAVEEFALKDCLQEHHWHLVALRWSMAGEYSLKVWRYENKHHQSDGLSAFERVFSHNVYDFGDESTVFLGAEVSGLDRNAQAVIENSLDGKIDSLRIAGHLLDDREIFSAAAYLPADETKASLLGLYNFEAGPGLSFRNLVAPNEAGAFHNLPLLGVTGIRWNGKHHCFRDAPEHYSAVHFHSDDQYDCGWSSDFGISIGDDIKSGIYAAKIVSDSGDTDYVPFFVVPARDAKKRSPIALMLPTMTYLAYANERMSDASDVFGFDVIKWGGEVTPDLIGYERLKQHPEFGSSLYDHHLDGGGRHFSSWLRPILNMRPRSQIWALVADTLIADWLEHCQFDFDIITDHMVHEEGVELLGKYKTVISGNHPEYVTTEILDALEEYTDKRGGRFIYMGGNGYYWVTALCGAAPAAIEIRRGVGGSGAWFSKPGEYYLQSTGDLGGLWRHVGRAPQQIFGVGTRGMGFPPSVGFNRAPEWDNPRVGFLTEGVTEMVLGDYGLLHNGAAGEEIDAVDYQLGTPAHALVIASSSNHPRGMMIAREDLRFVVPDEWVHSRVRADLTFFETKSGGAVLSLSSMTWCGSLSYNNFDNGVCRLSANAVRRFIAPEPFAMPAL